MERPGQQEDDDHDDDDYDDDNDKEETVLLLAQNKITEIPKRKIPPRATRQFFAAAAGRTRVAKTTVILRALVE